MKIIRIRDHTDFICEGAEWFHCKWGVSKEAYEESMKESFDNERSVPQWYVAVEGRKIIGGAGVVENDFHNRKDLKPNICALYVEEEYRCRGIAGELLAYICDDMNRMGIATLYLITDHTSFYERYGWDFLCMVQGEDYSDMSRMYIHNSSAQNV